MNLFGDLGQLTVLWPRMLWLYATLPVLLGTYLWLVARRRRARAAMAGFASLSASVGRGGRVRRTLPPLIFIAGLAALIGAVARPHAVVVLPSLHKDIMLAVDTSGSMRATDIKPNRLRAAQDAARTFVENQPRHTRIGLVTIAGGASVVQSPTDNREDLFQAIGRMQLQRGTALGSGIYIALAALLPDAGINLEHLVYGKPNWNWPNPGAQEKEKQPVAPGSNRSAAIVLLTDGEYNTGPDPLEAAKLAAEHGVRVYTVGIGSKEGFPLSFSGWSMRVSLDEDTLRRIATTTQGEFYAATSARDLTRIYEHLSARMTVERSRSIEVTAFLVAAGALLLLVSAFFSVLWFHRVL
jgi:Ca-activated chloride channel family protein